MKINNIEDLVCYYKKKEFLSFISPTIILCFIAVVLALLNKRYNLYERVGIVLYCIICVCVFVVTVFVLIVGLHEEDSYREKTVYIMSLVNPKILKVVPAVEYLEEDEAFFCKLENVNIANKSFVFYGDDETFEVDILPSKYFN